MDSGMDFPDAGLPDASTQDAGAPDAGVPDASTVDGGEFTDSGGSPSSDAALVMDAGAVPDANSTPTDGGASVEAGPVIDSGNGLDSGATPDAGSFPDAGSPPDAGPIATHVETVIFNETFTRNDNSDLGGAPIAGAGDWTKLAGPSETYLEISGERLHRKTGASGLLVAHHPHGSTADSADLFQFQLEGEFEFSKVGAGGAGLYVLLGVSGGGYDAPSVGTGLHINAKGSTGEVTFCDVGTTVCGQSGGAPELGLVANQRYRFFFNVTKGGGGAWGIQQVSPDGGLISVESRGYFDDRMVHITDPAHIWLGLDTGGSTVEIWVDNLKITRLEYLPDAGP
jgi:hypothetical protein